MRLVPSRCVSVFGTLLVLGAACMPLAHALEHGDLDGDCVSCLTPSGSVKALTTNSDPAHTQRPAARLDVVQRIDVHTTLAHARVETRGPPLS